MSLYAKLSPMPQPRSPPEIETRLGPFPEHPGLAPHEERLLFFDAVANVFAALARKQALLFYADDLHWADRSTLWLLSHLLRQLRTERVLIVGAYRETELDRAHPLAKSLVDWNRERLITRIVLRRFDKDETGAQLGALLGENVSNDFADAVHHETEGNPFFVEEVLKALIEKGSVRKESGHWQRCDVTELQIPQSVKEAIGHRLDRVTKECNELLRIGAVLGKTFSFAELSATAQQDEDTMLDALDQAVGAQLITAGHGDSFTFTHDKIREVLYEELNPIRRRRLHRHAAEGLELHRDRVSVEKLAHHYIQAGDHERGLHYAKEAAADAERVFAFDEAIAAYGRARDCAEALGLIDEQMAQEEAIGKAYLLHGETILAGEHFERALALTSDSQTRARLQCQAAASLVSTGEPRGLEYLQEALAVLDPQTNPLETANALSITGRFHHLAGRHGQAIDLLERAATLVAPAAAAETVSSFAAPMIAQLYAFTAGAYQHSGLFDNADVWARRAIEFGTTHNVLLAQASGFEFLGEDAVHKGEFEGGLAYAEREREICSRLHSRERRAWTHLVAAQCSSFLDRFEQAEREFVEGMALAESVGEQRVAALLRANYAVLQARTGRLDEALHTALANLEHSGPTSLLYSRFEALRCMALVRFIRASRSEPLQTEILKSQISNPLRSEPEALKPETPTPDNSDLETSDLNEALRLCEEASALVSPTESRVSRLWLGPLYIEVLLAQGKRATAKEKLHDYQQLTAECQSPRFSNEAKRLRALLGTD